MTPAFVPVPALFQAAVENSYDVVELLQEDGTILYISPSVTRVLGFEPQALLGTNAFELVHPEDRARLQEELAEALSRERGEVGTYRCRNSTGGWRWIKSTGSCLEFKPHGKTLVINSRDVTEQEESRRTAVKTSREMQAIWESMTDAFYAVDTEWRFTYVNGPGARLLQRQREELLGRFLWDEFPEAVNSPLFSQYHQAVQQQTAVNFEVFYPPLESWFEIHAYPSEAGLAVYFRDINASKAAEEERNRRDEEQRQARHFLHSVLDALSAHVAVVNEQGEILAVNAAWERFARENDGSGITCGVGANYLEVCDAATGAWASDAPQIARAIREVIAGRQSEFSQEYPCHSPTEKRWFNLRVTRFDDQVPGRVVIAHEDITQAHQTREALRYSQQLYQTLTENFPNGAVYLLDRQMSILLAGGRGLEQLGLSASNIIGKTAREVFASETNFALVEKAFERVLGGEVVSLEAEMRGYWRLVRAVPLFDENQAITGVMAMTQDITGHKRSQETQARLAAIVESSDDAISSMNSNGIIMTWNRGAERLYGYRADEIIGQSLEVLTPPGELSFMLGKVRSGESINNFETRRIRKDGSTFEISLNLSPLVDSQGQLVGSSVIARDVTERKQAEEALKSSERLYHTLAHNFPNGSVYLVDRDARIILAEGRGLAAVGLSTAEMIGRSFLDIFGSEELGTQLKEGHSRALAGVESSFEVQLKGRYRLVRLVPIRDDKGEVSVVLAMTQDTTEQRQAEEALRSSQDRLERAQKVAHLGYMEMEPATGHDFWSDETYRILGLEPQLTAPSFNSLLEHIHPDDRELVVKRARELFEGLQPFAFEHRVVRPRGEVRWVRAQAEVVLNAEGTAKRFVCTMLDITERKRAEEAQGRLAKIVGSSNDAIVSETLDGRIATWNRGAQQIYGYEESEVIGRNLSMLFPKQRPQEGADILEKLSRGEAIAPLEIQGQRKDGQTIDVSLTVSPILGDTGEIIGASSISRDITAQKQAEAERERFFSLSLDMLCTVDREGRFQRVNPAFEAVLGYKPEELEGRSALEYLHPDDYAASAAAVEQLFGGVALTSFNNRYVCSDGSYKSILWATAPYGDLLYAAGRDITTIKVFEQELERSVSLLQGTLESTADSIVVVDGEGRITHFNQQFATMWGPSVRVERRGKYVELLKQIKGQLTEPEEFEALTVRMLADPKLQGFDTLTFKDGRVFERFTKVQQLGEHNLGRVWSFRDVTERAQSVRDQAQLNHELEHQRRRLDEILTHVPGIVWENAIEPGTGAQSAVYVSKFVETFLGYSQQEWMENPNAWVESIHPLDLQTVFEESNNIIVRRRSGVLRYRMMTKDGHQVWTETHCAVVLNEQGAVVGLRGVTMDITERMEAQAEQSRLAALLESTSDLVAWADLEGQVQYVNPAGRALLGLGDGEADDTLKITDFMADWANELLLNEGLPSASKNGSWAGETAFINREGQEIPMSQVVTAHQDALGNDIFFSTIARDISESKRVQRILQDAKEELEQRVAERTAELVDSNQELQAEIAERQAADEARRRVVAQLEQAHHTADSARLEAEKAREEAEQANAAKSEFLSRMSHELRTPLNAILGFGQVLEMEMEEAPQLQRESIDHILAAGSHLLELINEVLDISRIESGNLTVSIEPVQLDRVLREVLSLMQPMASAGEVKLINDLPPGQAQFVLADRQRLQQVFINLLSNAIKYNRAGGSVTISGEEFREGTLRLKVHDTGMGLSESDLSKLFTPFDRLSAAQTQIEGTGIGLVLTRRLMEVMGGSIGVESALGEGSTFWIELPTTEAPVAEDDFPTQEMVNPAAAASDENRQTILYIEDNAPNLRLVEMLLEDRKQIRLLSSMQGRTGLEMAAQHLPDLILLDMHLPDINGDEVLRRLQADPATKNIPVVVISADATPNQVERLLASGAREYLTKPLNVKQFLAVLDEHLR